MNQSLKSSTAVRIGLWVPQVLGAVAFIAAGSAKWAGVPMMVALFDQIGIGQWFRLVTGSIEIIAGIGLLIPTFTVFAAVILAVTMAVAMGVHLFVVHTSPVGAVVLFALMLAIVWIRRERIPWL